MNITTLFYPVHYSLMMTTEKVSEILRFNFEVVWLVTWWDFIIHQLHNIISILNNIIMVTKSRSVIWATHMAYMGEMRNFSWDTWIWCNDRERIRSIGDRYVWWSGNWKTLTSINQHIHILEVKRPLVIIVFFIPIKQISEQHLETGYDHSKRYRSLSAVILSSHLLLNTVCTWFIIITFKNTAFRSGI
jgi:hypothetical protein